MAPILAIAIKDIRLLLRDPMGLFFAVGFPLITAIMFGTIFGGAASGDGPEEMEVAVVDLDGTDASRAMIEKIDAGSELNLVPYDSLDEGRRPVLSGKLPALVILPRGFGESSKNLFGSMGGGADGSEGVRFELEVDPSQAAASGMLEGILTKYAFEGMQAMFTDPSAGRAQMAQLREQIRAGAYDGGDLPDVPAFSGFVESLDAFLASVEARVAEEEAKETLERERHIAESPDKLPELTESTQEARRGWQPFTIEKRSVADAAAAAAVASGAPPPAKKAEAQSLYAVTFPQGVAWALIGSSLAFAIGMVIERQQGTLLRLRVAPLTAAALLLGKAAAAFATSLLICTVLLAIGILFFGIQPRSYPLLTAAVISACLCFVGVMMLVSVLGKTEKAAAGLGWGVMLMFAMVGGAMIPLQFLDWLKPVSVLSPVRWTILAVESGIWRAMPARELALAHAVLIAIGVIGFAIGARLYAKARIGVAAN